MGDDPIAWNAMKERRKEEKQRRAVAIAKKLAEKFSTEILTELPSQAEFPGQLNEWEIELEKARKRNKTYFLEKHCAILGIEM